MGLPVMTWLCALGNKNTAWKQALTGTAGLLALYTAGLLGLMISAGLTPPQAFLTGVLPFIAKDIPSLAAALLLARTISKRLPSLHRPAKHRKKR